jgi:hypothetical protein
MLVAIWGNGKRHSACRVQRGPSILCPHVIIAFDTRAGSRRAAPVAALEH